MQTLKALSINCSASPVFLSAIKGRRITGQNHDIIRFWILLFTVLSGGGNGSTLSKIPKHCHKIVEKADSFMISGSHLVLHRGEICATNHKLFCNTWLFSQWNTIYSMFTNQLCTQHRSSKSWYNMLQLIWKVLRSILWESNFNRNYCSFIKKTEVCRWYFCVSNLIGFCCKKLIISCIIK